jgi:hypothetical protein
MTQSSAASVKAVRQARAAIWATMIRAKRLPMVSRSSRPMRSSSPDVANRRERRLTEQALERFGLPVTEVVSDRDGRVLSVSAN